MSPGFRIFQTKSQSGNVREITLQNGQTRNFSSPSRNDPWPEVLLTRINNHLNVSFYDTGITLVIRVHERPNEYHVDFEIRVPRRFQQKTRGFFGNLDDNDTNDFYRRSGTTLILQPETATNRLSEAQLLSIFQSCKF